MKLTAKEAVILSLLQAHPNEIVTRRELCCVLWGEDWAEKGKGAALSVHVSTLRKKLGWPNPIQTINESRTAIGGYKLVVPEEAK